VKQVSGCSSKRTPLTVLLDAGKSTLVKTLISLGEAEAEIHQQPAQEFPSPVAGSINNELNATSEGVHLYADPGKYYERLPILYADCEGLNAGEQIPFALQSIRSRTRSDSGGRKKLVKRSLQGVSREIHWARATENSSRRDFAVRHLYPRILYTFSDVIVFVQKNPK
jgi:hypothetical protein